MYQFLIGTVHLVDWYCISKYQKLSENFIAKHKYQFLIGTVQQVNISARLMMNGTEKVSIPHRYGTTLIPIIESLERKFYYDRFEYQFLIGTVQLKKAMTLTEKGLDTYQFLIGTVQQS